MDETNIIDTSNNFKTTLSDRLFSERRIERLNKFNDIARAVFVLLLVISSNFVTSTFNCDLLHQFYNNPYVTHAFVIAIIFFSINILGNPNKDETFNNVMYKSLYVYLVYLLLTKQSPGLFLISVILIVSIFLLTYYFNNKDEKNDLILDNTNYYLEIILFVVLLYGFYFSITKEYSQNKDNFNFFNYLFKIYKC